MHTNLSIPLISIVFHMTIIVIFKLFIIKKVNSVKIFKLHKWNYFEIVNYKLYNNFTIYYIYNL